MKKQQLLISVLFVLSALFPASTYALDAIDHSGSVFKFQQKLANSGNAQAQYRLGYLYETGEGVKTDFDKALHWYERAASTGVRAAEQRRDYLMVRELGYNKKTNKAWLDSVKKDAADHKEPAVLLLGQLYHQGIGVRKNLDKSLTLLTEVASLGAAGVDKEIAAVQAELDAKQRKKHAIVKPATVQQAVTSKKAVTAKPVTKSAQKKRPAPAKKSQAEIAAELKAEKKRRYEMIMEQIRREQRLIDEQQASVSGEEVVSIDDEI